MGIEELISRIFWTRDIAHSAHWGTGNYAQHMALGTFYKDIVDKLDEIVEAYQGKFGKVKPFLTSYKVPQDVISHLEEDEKWIAGNKKTVTKEVGAICNLVDELSELYLTTLYKLKNLS